MVKYEQSYLSDYAGTNRDLIFKTCQSDAGMTDLIDVETGEIAGQDNTITYYDLLDIENEIKYDYLLPLDQTHDADMVELIRLYNRRFESYFDKFCNMILNIGAELDFEFPDDSIKKAVTRYLGSWWQDLFDTIMGPDCAIFTEDTVQKLKDYMLEVWCD